MHDTAMEIGCLVMDRYSVLSRARILELGSYDINGSLRSHAPATAEYVGLDLEAGPGVDFVVEAGKPWPVQDDYFDLVLASSVFEHDPMFWVTFLQMIRKARKGGYIYVSAPSNGSVHRHPQDSWRFYPDSGVALVRWAKSQGEEVTLVESFTAGRKGDQWNDFVAVFRKGEASADLPTDFVYKQFNSFNILTWQVDDLINPSAMTEDMAIIEGTRTKVRELEEQVTEISTEKQAAWTEWQKAERALLVAETRLSQEEAGHEKSRSQIFELGATVQRQHLDIEWAKGEISRYQGLAEDYEAARQDLAQQLEHKEQAVEEARAQLAAHEEQLGELRTSNEALVSELEHKEQAVTEALARLAAHEAKLEELQASNEALLSELDVERAAAADAANLRDLLATAESMLLQRQEEVSQAWQEVEALRQALADQRAETEAAGAELVRFKEKLQDSEAWVFKLAGERRTAELRLVALERQLAKSEHTSTAAAGEAERANAALEEMHRSLADVRSALRKAEQTLAERPAGPLPVEEQRAKPVPAVPPPHPGRETEEHLAGTGAEAALEQIRQQYRELARANMALSQQAAWAFDVATELSMAPRGWRRWLPAWLIRARIIRRISRKNVFHAREYLDRYPDVSEAGLDPLTHYLLHGRMESRDGMPDTHARRQGAADGSGWCAQAIALGMFDPEWYRKSRDLPEMTDEELFQDYLDQSAIDPLCDPGPLFSSVHYQSENPDVRGIHPLEHLVLYGMKEGRRAFSPHRADRFMAEVADQTVANPADQLDRSKPVVVLHWDRGNFFFSDIARYVAEWARRLGFKAEDRTHHDGLDLASCNLIIVAPHEYCVHGPGRDWGREQLQGVILVNTEQWHTSWFALSLWRMLASGRAWDINPASARGLSRLGIDAAFLPLLPLPGGTFDSGGGKPSPALTAKRWIRPLTDPAVYAERSIDVAFLGVLNDRRGEVLARTAPVLARHRCFIHAPRFHGPVSPDHVNMISNSDFAHIARNTKILLNIHQGESHYFEWHRLFLSGIAQGCVVLTEPCTAIGVLTEGEHYLTATARQMPAKLDWLLGTREGQAELARVHEAGKKILKQLMEQGEAVS